MASTEDLRTAALALPEVEEGTHFGMTAYAVRGKGFASLTRDGWLQLQLGTPDLDAVLGQHPGAEAITRGDKRIGARVLLESLDHTALEALLLASWKARAPRSLTGSFDDQP